MFYINKSTQKVVIFGVSCFLEGKNNLDEDRVEHVVELVEQALIN